MSNIKSVHPELLEETAGTTRKDVTGTYDSVKDKMSQDINIHSSEELESIMNCLNTISGTLLRMEELLQAIAE